MSGMPKSVVIDLVDSLTSYHCPYQGSVHPRGKYGPRRGASTRAWTCPLKMGDPVYATFCGRVRISQYNKGGYGNLVIIRHDNGWRPITATCRNVWWNPTSGSRRGRSSVWAVRRAVRRVPISISKPVTTGSRSTPNA